MEEEEEHIQTEEMEDNHTANLSNQAGVEEEEEVEEERI